jgi:SAM-dependent methyltransferase
VSVFENDVRSWEELARSDPYWAVLSGEEHVEHVCSVIRSELDPSFSPTVAVDFGCGVGRNLVPLARRCDRAIGLDVSPTMVERSAARLAECGLRDAQALVVDRRIDTARLAAFGPVDFVHSVLVFQHIVPEEGFELLDQLLELLAPGGHGFLQFYGRGPGSDVVRALRGLRVRHRWFNSLVVRSRLRPLTESLVMLYEYDVLELLRHLAAHQVEAAVVERIEESGGGYQVRFYFTKFAGTQQEYAAAGRAMQVRLRP